MFGLGELAGTALFAYVVLPLLIFLSRLFDVSMGTVRVILTARGKKLIASIIGFFEVLVWIVVVAQILNNIQGPLSYIAYAAGFASGTYLGIWLESKLAIGAVSLRIITRTDASELIEELRGNSYGVTSLNAEGRDGRVNVIYMLVSRHNLDHVIKTVKKFNPRAFYYIEDVRFVSEGVFPRNHNHRTIPSLKMRRMGRKKR